MPPAMFRSSAKPLSGRYLSLAEREEIALLNVQGHSIREIGRRLGRAASTISRELRSQCSHPRRRDGISGDDRSVACRSIGPPPQADQACAQHHLAHLCGRATCRCRRGPERRSRSWSRRSVEGPSAWPAQGSAMGQSLEPRADCPTLADRLPGRQDDAHQPRSYLSSPLRSGPWSAAPRADGLLANRTCVTDAQGARTQARQRLCLAGDHDQ